jgi:hypothetical protein
LSAYLYLQVLFRHLGASDDLGGCLAARSAAAWRSLLALHTLAALPSADPDLCLPGDNVDDLLRHIYSELTNIQDSVQRQQYLIERAILTPLNDDVNSLNERILHMFPTSRLAGL